MHLRILPNLVGTSTCAVFVNQIKDTCVLTKKMKKRLLTKFEHRLAFFRKRGNARDLCYNTKLDKTLDIFDQIKITTRKFYE